MAENVQAEAGRGDVEDWRSRDWSLLPPSERLITLPLDIPDRTLGWGVVAWITDNLIQPNGEFAGQPFRCTEFQVRFILHFYAVNEQGDFVYNEGVRRLAKGSGKSPFAAVLALAELLGPVMFDRFDDDVPGGCVGRKRPLSWVQVVATAEEQTKNTMRMVRAMVNHKACRLKQRFELDVGKTYIEVPDGSKLEQITSAWTTAEGNEVTFVVSDETEHWEPSKGGPQLYETLLQNVAKTNNARLLQTSNAWEPGGESVAESTWEAWQEQEEGRTVAERRLLYDAICAPFNTSLSPDTGDGEVSLDEALAFVYQDCSWAALDNIKNTIWKPNYPQSRSWRFFLNRPVASEDSWCPTSVFMECHDPDRVVKQGEDVVLFFDGSKSNDHTALVGCCLSDGFVFTLGVWEPDEATGVIDADVVDRAVLAARDTYNVVAFWADVREWESFVKNKWRDDFVDSLLVWAVPHGKLPEPIAWDMRSKGYQFAQATEQCLDEIVNHRFAHDGHWELVKHVGNCRVKEYRGLWSVKKESPKSRNKIDAAVCMIGARMLYHVVKSSPEWERASSEVEWSFGW